MPRKTTLRLDTYGKQPDGYKVCKEAGWLLAQSGWRIKKRTPDYWFVESPTEQPKAKTIDVSVNVPTDDEIVAAATELRENANPGERTVAIIHGWPFDYMPAHTRTITYQETDFLGLNGPDWVPPPPEISKHEEQPVCRVGFILIWHVEVRWRADGTPFLRKYTGREITVDEQFSLFGQRDVVERPTPTTIEVNAERPTLGPEEVPPGDYAEGAIKSVLVNAYERNSTARQACIEHWGAKCQVCDFDFEQRYGPLGRGFIHVHHTIPLGEIGHEYRVNPIEDLRPVCPNCHAMVHSQNPPLTIATLRKLLRPG